MATVIPPPTLRRYFHEELPLGPIDAAGINDDEVVAYLQNFENAAVIDMARGASILMGKRGAGKSSVLKAFSIGNRLTDTVSPFNRTTAFDELFSGENDLRKNYARVVEVDYEKESRSVIARIMESKHRSPELAAEFWDEQLWINVIKQVSQSETLISQFSDELRSDMTKIGRYIDENYSRQNKIDFFDLYSSIGRINAPSLSVLVKQVKSSFVEKENTVIFLIDSGEEYDVYDPAVRNCIGGLFTLIGKSSALARPSIYKMAFASEAFRHVSSEMNPEKYSYRTTRLSWRAIDLIRIVTNRMLICLSFNNPEFLVENGWDSRNAVRFDRGRILKFWEKMFITDHANEARHPENPIVYVLRHTQLLPRQVIGSLTNLLKNSRLTLGDYKAIDLEVFDSSIEGSADTLIDGVAYAYKNVYPRLKDKLHRFMPFCKILSTYDELEQIFQSSGVRERPLDYSSDFQSFLFMLLEVGAFGVHDPAHDTQFYISARFDYTGVETPPYSATTMFAMHPAFSKRFCDVTARLEPGKAVLPNGTLQGIDE